MRLLGLLPVVAVAIVAWQPLYAAAYHELVLPDDLASPLGIRVVRDVPWAVAAADRGLGRWPTPPRRSASGASSSAGGPILAAWLLGWIGPRRGGRCARSRRRRSASPSWSLLAGPALLAAAAGWARVRDVMTHRLRRRRRAAHGRDLGRGVAGRAWSSPASAPRSGRPPGRSRSTPSPASRPIGRRRRRRHRRRRIPGSPTVTRARSRPSMCVLRSSGASLLDCARRAPPGASCPMEAAPRVCRRDPRHDRRRDRRLHRQPDRAVRAPGARRLLRHPLARGRVLGVPRHAAAQREPDPPVPRGGPDRPVHAAPVRVRHHRLPDHPAAREDRRGLRAQPGRGGAARRGRGDQDLPVMPAARQRRMDHLPDLPHAAQPRVRELRPPRRPRLGPVRVVRPRLRARRPRRLRAHLDAAPGPERRDLDAPRAHGPAVRDEPTPRTGRVRQPPSAGRSAPGTIPEP